MAVSTTNQSSTINSALRLDQAARLNVLAQTEQNVLRSIGLFKGGSKSDGLTLSPLKSLFSAAAGSYVDALKRNDNSMKLSQGVGGYGDLASFRKQLEAELAAQGKGEGGVSDEAGTTITLGGAPGTTAIKHQEASTILNKALGAVQNAGGTVTNNRDGTYKFSVGTFKGTLSINGDVIFGEASSGGKPVGFKKNTHGDVGIESDGSASDQDGLNVKRITALLAGDTSGLRSLTTREAQTGDKLEVVDDPAGEGEAESTGGAGGTGTTNAKDDTFSDFAGVTTRLSQDRTGELIGRLDSYLKAVDDGEVTVDRDRVNDVLRTLAEFGSSDKVRDKSEDYAGKYDASTKNSDMMTAIKNEYAAGGGTAAAPVVEAPVAEAPLQSVDDVLTTMLGVSNPNLISTVLTGGTAADKAKANAKLYIEDLNAAGATFTGAARNKVSFTLNGVAGTIEIKGDRVEGKYGKGSKEEVKFRIENDGKVKLDGDNKQALARINSNTLRRAMGKSGAGDTKQEFTVSRYNRSGGILNLLG